MANGPSSFHYNTIYIANMIAKKQEACKKHARSKANEASNSNTGAAPYKR